MFQGEKGPDGLRGDEGEKGCMGPKVSFMFPNISISNKVVMCVEHPTLTS